MTKLILSTSNIVGGGPSIIRRPTFEKSNTELTNSLRANFQTSQQSAAASEASSPGHSSPNPTSPVADGSQVRPPSWTTLDASTLYIPRADFSTTRLAEERSQYDITVKLFFLPTTTPASGPEHTRSAINLVLKALNSPSIDLLIVSFPSVSFDADDDSDSDLDPSPNTDADAAGTENVMDEMIATWRALESLHDEGIVTQLGLAEFGSSRLKQFLPHTRIRPGVDQINVRDCCVVPRSLILYAKEQGIQLLTHNDCTNILPKGTIRDILGEGEKGFGILAGDTSGVEKKPASSGFLVGEIEPQWVVKYTAVVTDRGVIENKGYFAMAEMRE